MQQLDAVLASEDATATELELLTKQESQKSYAYGCIGLTLNKRLPLAEPYETQLKTSMKRRLEKNER